MTSPNLSFDGRDLALAARDSCGYSKAFGLDLPESAARALQHRAAAAEILPTRDDDIDVLRIDLDSVTGAAGHLRRDQRGPLPRKGS